MLSHALLSFALILSSGITDVSARHVQFLNRRERLWFNPDENTTSKSSLNAAGAKIANETITASTICAKENSPAY
jgi:hypothetical protein